MVGVYKCINSTVRQYLKQSLENHRIAVIINFCDILGQCGET